MAPVPAFDARGFLPPFQGPETSADRSPYQATMVELVNAMGTTPPRRQLLKGLLDYRAMLTRLDYTSGLQFVDGSFVENVEMREGRPPGDIDVFSFLVRPTRYQADPDLWTSRGNNEWNSEIVNVVLNKSRYGVESYAVAVDQNSRLSLITVTTYWYSLFAHKKLTRDWKGFLRILLNPADDAAAASTLLV